MWKEGVDVSITGNSTNPTRFQHPVAGTYKKECVEAGKKYFSVASGGGTGRTLHPDNMAAGPASYGMTDTLGRMHSDAQFAGSSSVPAHVEMMGWYDCCCCSFHRGSGKGRQILIKQYVMIFMNRTGLMTGAVF